MAMLLFRTILDRPVFSFERFIFMVTNLFCEVVLTVSIFIELALLLGRPGILIDDFKVFETVFFFFLTNVFYAEEFF